MAVSDKFTFACLPDRISGPHDSVVWTEGSEASADLTSENLADDVLSRTWRSNGPSVQSAWVQASFIGSTDTEVQSVAMVSHNMLSGDLFRIRVSESTPPPTPFETVIPSGTIATYTGFTNNAGGTPPLASEIDESCDAPNDTDFAKSINSGARTILVPFATPAGTLVAGAEVQEFRARVKIGSGSIADYSINMTVYESGSAKGLGQLSPGDLSIDGTTADVVMHWDSTLISNKANVECLIKVIGNTGNTVWIDCVEWNAAITPAASDYDTGWLPVYDGFTDQAFGDAAVSDLGGGVNWSFSSILDTALTDATYIRVDFITANAYAEVGRMLAGPIWVPEFSVDYGWSIGVEDSSTVKQSLSGGTFVRNKYRKRIINATLSNIDNEEMLQNSFMYLDLNLGVGAGVVLVPEPLRTGVQTLQNGYYRLKSTGQYTNDYFNKMTRSYSFVEW